MEIYINEFKEPKLVILNKSLANYLDLNIKELLDDNGLSLSGNTIPEGGNPISQAYAGHQFGHFTMLGDGRAILLGEQINSKGSRYDVQLKGAGRTPYSRGGDGKAALGPMLREYIISETLFNLKIPTTRSLAVVLTGEKVIRESDLDGAVLTRVASSHIRIGTFEFIASRGSKQELKELADYTIQRHYPKIAESENKYLLFLRQVIKRQASLIAKWQQVGFIHGVMNTDNMLVSGESIDFGPCAFMDNYKANTVFSSIDSKGRYAYKNQPDIDTAIKIANKEISSFYNLFKQYWITGMREKLGLFDEDENDQSLINELLTIMEKYKGDYTNVFRCLTLGIEDDMDVFKSLEYVTWKKKWLSRLDMQDETKGQINELMKKSNPLVIPRNHRVEEALEAATRYSDYHLFNKLLEVLSNPYEYSADKDEYAKVKASKSPYVTYCGT